MIRDVLALIFCLVEGDLSSYLLMLANYLHVQSHAGQLSTTFIYKQNATADISGH
jgi:hypothetical protein